MLTIRQHWRNRKLRERRSDGGELSASGSTPLEKRPNFVARLASSIKLKDATTSSLFIPQKIVLAHYHVL
jgi:hypothetical protein